MLISILCFMLIICSAYAETRVYFSPSLDCETKIVELINGACDTIDVAVYAINNKNIVSALKNANSRVKIRILTDRTQAKGKGSMVRDLYYAGVDIKLHSKYKIEHNKFAIFDKKIVITGSYNWTNPASTKNSENCLIITKDSKTTNSYQQRFNYLWMINTGIN